MIGTLIAQFPCGVFMKWICSALLLAASGSLLTAESLKPEGQILEGVIRADLHRHEDVREYSVMRRYTLTDKRSGKASRMLVRMTYRKGQGKSFQIVDATGAEGLHRRVLQKIVDNEAESSRAGKADQYRINGNNYAIKLIGQEVSEGHPCYLVELTPRRKSKYLLQGKAWIDKEDLAVVRIEGRPTESLSFWVGKPYIIQSFQKVGGYWMASHNTSLSESRLFGTNELTIDYSGYNVNGGTQENLAEQLSRKRPGGGL
jgi:hypothetical protein